MDSTGEKPQIKKRWTFGRIVKWSVVGFIGLWVCAFAVDRTYKYMKWKQEEERTQPQILTSFAGFTLGQDTKEVLFRHGEPTEKNEESWNYFADSGYGGKLTVEFKNNQVTRVALSSQALYREPPDIFGFRTGSYYDHVLKKLGTPSRMVNTEDGLSRALIYDHWNTFFIFEKAQLNVYGIQDPALYPAK